MRSLALAAMIAAGLFAAGASIAATAEPEPEPAPEPLRGDWVPASATCGSLLRLRVAGDRMQLINGRDQESYGDIAWPQTYVGPPYRGITVVALPDAGAGRSSFTVFFNADEHVGTAKLGILQGDLGAAAGNPAYLAIVRSARALNQRFPLDNVALRKCAAEAAAVRDLSGHYTYRKRGVAVVTQDGAAVRVLMTWTPVRGGPHYEVRGRLVGDRIVGEWYSHYAHRGWFRFVGTVRPSGEIDLAQSEDPIRAEMRGSMLTPDR